MVTRFVWVPPTKNGHRLQAHRRAHGSVTERLRSTGPDRSYSLLQIAVQKSLENLRWAPYAVIVTETVHRFSPLCYNFDVAIIARILYKCKVESGIFWKRGILNRELFQDSVRHTTRKEVQYEKWMMLAAAWYC